jgi:hypothetical protein
VGDHGLVHADVTVITEVQQFFSSELSAIVGNDGVRDPKTKNDVLDEIHGLLGADLAKGFTLTHLVNLSTMVSMWVKPPDAFLKGPRRLKPRMVKGQVMGIILELLGRGVNLSSKVLASPTEPYCLCHIAGCSQPLKTLLESHPDQAP